MEMSGQLHAVDVLPPVLTGWVLDAQKNVLQPAAIPTDAMAPPQTTNAT
jgi:hypothetical protein